MYLGFTLVALCALFYCLFAKRMSSWPVSSAMIFILAGVVFGPQGLGVLELEHASAEVRILADLTLALLLFADASSIKAKTLARVKYLAIRMLLIGLPLSIFCGYLLARFMFPELGMWDCALLATALAATDAALGKPVVTNPSVSEPLRTTVNLESGLNDGLCVPLLLLFIALSKELMMDEASDLAMGLFLSEIGIGAVLGVLITWLGSKAVRLATEKQWASIKWVPMSISVIALLCFLITQNLHGSGYIASFVGGLTFSLVNKNIDHDLVDDTETSGELLGMLTWILFGTLLYHTVSLDPSWKDWAYGILSLTVVRMLPTLLVLTGTGLNLPSKVFLAWFGPRGLASVAFAFIIINSQIPNAAEIVPVICCTIVLSVALHGISALPYIKRFAHSLG
ncbi:cation:proton antiporter [Rubritalea marina]|uniref:cation:proton antiporter domain-containing protein n=1 Tax=Rubritalea marina TaxID=361055 RepID=UPI000376DCC2|nr:cation:proton antiporter [Rubritalea marina]